MHSFASFMGLWYARCPFAAYSLQSRYAQSTVLNDGTEPVSTMATALMRETPFVKPKSYR